MGIICRAAEGFVDWSLGQPVLGSLPASWRWCTGGCPLKIGETQKTDDRFRFLLEESTESFVEWGKRSLYIDHFTLDVLFKYQMPDNPNCGVFA